MISSTMLAIFDSLPPSLRKEGRHQGQIHWLVCTKVTSGLAGTPFSFYLRHQLTEIPDQTGDHVCIPDKQCRHYLVWERFPCCQQERRHLFFWEESASPEGPGSGARAPGEGGQISGGCFRRGKPQLPSVLGSTWWPLVPGESPGLLCLPCLCAY